MRVDCGGHICSNSAIGRLNLQSAKKSNQTTDQDCMSAVFLSVTVLSGK